MNESVEPECPDFSVRSVSLGGSALSRALQLGEEPASGWILERPSSVGGWKMRSEEIRSDFSGRDWLAQLAPAFGSAAEKGSRLWNAASRGVVVTTGQQPGLFGGPLYTVSKAISALAFANELERSTGIPTAPVFWAATDDSDWLESSITYVVGRNGLEPLQLSGPASNGVAMSQVRLGDTAALYDTLLAASGSAAWSRVLEYARDAYVPHATIGSAYVQLMRALFEPLGIAVLDASHPSLREGADGFLRSALGKAPAVRDSLNRNQDEIRSAGFTPQVEIIDELSLVFRTSIEGGGTPIRVRVPIAEAPRAAREAEVGTLGSNVLLRPVLERFLLPTVAYHAGPGELAYFAQATAVARSLGAAAPQVVPRWAGEIVPADATRALERLGMDESIIRLPHEAEKRIAHESLDGEVADALERLRVAIDTQTRVLADAVERAALTAPTVTAGVLRDLQWKVSRLERRLLSASRNRETQTLKDLSIARGYLCPDGKSPERVLNPLPFLARYGTQILEEMLARASIHARRLIDGESS